MPPHKKPGQGLLPLVSTSNERIRPTFAEEEQLWQSGYHIVAGVDEVGRGPIAGPVVAGAAILPSGADYSWLSDVRDSKQLSPRQRDRLCDLITRDALAVGIGVCTHDRIDEIGIAPATRRAMEEAIHQLRLVPEALLIDAVRLPRLVLPQRSLIKGDERSLSIAVASIVAKVARDQMMVELDATYPGYGFAQHKGYPTPAHVEALRRLGPSPVHRRSFFPVRSLMALVPEAGW